MRARAYQLRCIFSLNLTAHEYAHLMAHRADLSMLDTDTVHRILLKKIILRSYFCMSLLDCCVNKAPQMIPCCCCLDILHSWAGSQGSANVRLAYTSKVFARAAGRQSQRTSGGRTCQSEDEKPGSCGCSLPPSPLRWWQPEESCSTILLRLARVKDLAVSPMRSVATVYKNTCIVLSVCQAQPISRQACMQTK